MYKTLMLSSAEKYDPHWYIQISNYWTASPYVRILYTSGGLMLNIIYIILNTVFGDSRNEIIDAATCVAVTPSRRPHSRRQVNINSYSDMRITQNISWVNQPRSSGHTAIYQMVSILVMAAVFIGLASPCAAQVEPLDRDDARDAAFFGLSVTAPLDDKTHIFGFGGRRVGELDFTIAQLGLRRQVNENFAVSAGYFGLFQPSTPNRPNPKDDRFVIDGEYAVNSFGFRVFHRSQFEYRVRDVENGWRYRPAFGVSRPVQAGSVSVTPFASIEPFYDFNEDRFTVVLSRVGVDIPLSPKITLEPLYIHATVFDAPDLNFYSLLVKYKF